MNPTQALIKAIERAPGGVEVVWCPDLGLRDWLVDEVAGLAGPTAAPFRTASVDEAIKTPHRMALLIPDDERAVVEELEGRRDQLLADPSRTQPVMLFLLRDGDGRVALAKAPGLSGWVRGSDVDPERIAEVDATSERSQFQAEVVLALISRRTDHVHQFTAMIEGETQTGLPWAAAVHLEDDRESAEEDRKGSGACGHAAFHCHVGPTLDHEPKVRVPLPAIGPADALDWLLSIVVPGWEPAPWGDVIAASAHRQPAVPR